MSTKNIRRFHVVNGMFTYSNGCVALVLGLFSTWFTTQAGLALSFLLVGAIATIAAFVGMQILLHFISVDFNVRS